MSPGEEAYEAWRTHVSPGSPQWYALSCDRRLAWEAMGDATMVVDTQALDEHRAQSEHEQEVIAEQINILQNLRESHRRTDNTLEAMEQALKECVREYQR